MKFSKSRAGLGKKGDDRNLLNGRNERRKGGVKRRRRKKR